LEHWLGLKEKGAKLGKWRLKGTCNSLEFDHASFIMTGSGICPAGGAISAKISISYRISRFAADSHVRKSTAIQRKRHSRNYEEVNKGAPKKESRPSTRGGDPRVAARMPPSLIAEVEAWAAANNTSRSDAFRQLVELGLARTKSAGSTSAKSAERARQLAAKTIDFLIDPRAPAEETASRKRRLLKGPEEFREVRVDSGKETRSAG
jgi:hypothetical protein